MVLLPQGPSCSNCGALRTMTPCPVCGFRSVRPAVYPIGHDELTDSYIADPMEAWEESLWSVPQTPPKKEDQS